MYNVGWLILASGDKQPDLVLPLHRRVYSTVYSVLSECLWKKTSDMCIVTDKAIITVAAVQMSQ